MNSNCLYRIAFSTFRMGCVQGQPLPENGTFSEAEDNSDISDNLLHNNHTHIERDKIQPDHEWALYKTFYLSQWIHGASSLGFDAAISYSKDYEQTQPWTTQGRVFEVSIPSLLFLPSDDEIDNFPMPNCNIPREYIYATMSVSESEETVNVNLPRSYIYDDIKSSIVLACRDAVLLIQVIRKTQSQRFLDLYLVHSPHMSMDVAYLVDTITLLDNKHCITSSRNSPMMDCIISPDYTCILGKPSTGHSANVVSSQIKCYYMYSDNWNLFVLDSQGTDPEVISYVFDPRYRHSRVFLANVMQKGKPVLQVVDLHLRSVIQAVQLVPSAAHRAQTLKCSTDGLYIVALMCLGVTSQQSSIFLSDVRIFDSQDLSCIHVIRQPNWKPIGYLCMSPATIFPMFNKNGSLLAVGVGMEDLELRAYELTSVAVYKVPCVLNLQAICRRHIIRFVDKSMIPLLPIPVALQNYLQFKSESY